MDGGEDIFCHVSVITDGNVLREGDMVEYEQEYDDRKGKYRAINVTRGRREEEGSDKRRGGGGCAAPRPAEKVNIAINKEIMACNDVQDLCSVIQNRVIEFNHVNVATAFRKLLLTPRHDAARGTVDQALRALEESALRNIGDFGPQPLANTLHAMAKARYTPTNPLVLEALDRQVEALAGTFNAQDVANTLWSYATMGRRG